MPANKAVDLGRQLAGFVLCTRAKFAQIYDATITELGNKSQPFLAAVLDDDLEPPPNDVLAFGLAFQRAIEDNWIRLLVRRGLEQDALSQKALELMKAQAPAPVTDAEKNAQVQLQAVLDVAAGFDDPSSHISGMIRTMPKICQVLVQTQNAQSAGTGFLIGPQTVLTAWHVIAPLLDPATGEELPGSDQKLKVVFDYFDSPGNGGANTRTYGVVREWLGENSSCLATERPAGEGIPEALQAADVDTNHLDFAVIKLKGSPGRDRGTVELRDDFLQLPKNGGVKLTVFQHPNKFPQRFSSGNVSGFFGTGDPPPRLRHLANTASGSSGGLCADSEFKGVALHQATVLDDAGKPIANQAVPSGYIRKQLQAAFSFDPELDPLWKLADKAETPVIGREPFQESVWRASRGEKRVIVVRGPARTGRGFSAEILRSLRPANDAVIVRLTADMIGTDAVMFATRLLELAGRKLGPGESFPARAAAGTADAAWLRDQLLPDLVTRIQVGSSGKVVWIVVDHLDRFEVTNGEARDLLLALIGATIDASFLRFLLLGARNFVPGISPDLVEDDTPGWPTTTDIEAYIRRLGVQMGKAFTPDQMNMQVQLVFQEINASPQTQSNQWEVAAKYMAEKLRPAMKAGN